MMSKIKKLLFVVTCFSLFTFLCPYSSVHASSSIWDPVQQLLLIRGIGIMESGDNATYYLVLGNLDTSQGTVILEVFEGGPDNLQDEAVFYLEDYSLNFYLDMPDGFTYDIWAQLIEGNSGRLFLVFTHWESY